MSKKNRTSLLLLVISLVAFSLFVYIRKSNRKQPGTLSYQTFETGNGWGYRVFAADTMLLIQQETIPGIEGIQGFDSEQKAARTAAFVISKIKKGIFPPTLEKKELDSLEVL